MKSLVRNYPTIVSMNSYGEIKVIVDNKMYLYKGVDTAIYSKIKTLMKYAPYRALQTIIKSAKSSKEI